VVLPFSGVTLQPETIANIMVGGKLDATDRTITNAKFHYDYRDMLVMTMPRSDSCVRVLNPLWPEFSTADTGLTLASAPYSKVENILPDAKPAAPPQPPFPAEPAHGWCYYYQKADLARQQGDWQAVARLGDEARKQKLAPNDAIEWLPFVQAYAFTGDLSGLQSAAKAVKKEPYYRLQACQNLRKMNKGHYPPSSPRCWTRSTACSARWSSKTISCPSSPFPTSVNPTATAIFSAA
jgi:hypothetical protein